MPRRHGGGGGGGGGDGGGGGGCWGGVGDGGQQPAGINGGHLAASHGSIDHPVAGRYCGREL
jgi:hypothetical protein